jgi:hypothetical protein
MRTPQLKEKHIMKITLNTYQIADELKRDTCASWSYNGSLALAEYLEEYEADSGEEMELDTCAIRCDFSETTSLQEWAADYFSGDWREQIGADMDDIKEILSRADLLEAAGEIADANETREHADGIFDSAIREYIQDHGTLIEFDGGVIVSSF